VLLEHWLLPLCAWTFTVTGRLFNEAARVWTAGRASAIVERVNAHLD
jgi:hypothetical protein